MHREYEADAECAGVDRKEGCREICGLCRSKLRRRRGPTLRQLLQSQSRTSKAIEKLVKESKQRVRCKRENN